MCSHRDAQRNGYRDADLPNQFLAVGGCSLAISVVIVRRRNLVLCGASPVRAFIEITVLRRHGAAQEQLRVLTSGTSLIRAAI
jgi:hypothetical protein